MKRMSCEMCGGNDLVKQDGVFVCQNCGTKYSAEEAKKLFVENTVNVNIENTDAVSSNIVGEIQNKKSNRTLIVGSVFAIISVILISAICILSYNGNFRIAGHLIDYVSNISCLLAILIPSIIIIAISLFTIIKPEKFNLVFGIVNIAVYGFIVYQVFALDDIDLCSYVFCISSLGLGIIGVFLSFFSSIFKAHEKKK